MSPEDPATNREGCPGADAGNCAPDPEALLDNPARLVEVLFDRMPMGIAVFDRGLVLRRCNLTWAGYFEHHLGLPASEVVPGKSFFDLAPGTEASAMPLFERVLGGEKVRREAYHLTGEAGADTYWDVELTPLMEGERVAGFVAAVADATERVQTLHSLGQRLGALVGVATNLSIDHPLEATLDPLAAEVAKASTAVACSVVLVEKGTERLRLVGSYDLPEGYAAATEASWRAGAQSPAGQTLRSGQPVFLPDARQRLLVEPLYSPLHGFLGQAPWEGAFIVPLISWGETLGTINLYYPPEKEPKKDEKVFVRAIADQAAVAVENVGLYEQAGDRAALGERQRLARELHDSVSQDLYGISLVAKTTRTLLDSDPSQVGEPLEYVRSLAEASLAEMRALIFELRPESLEAEGLVAALEKQAAALRARHEIEVYPSLCQEPEVALEIKESLYRVAREALHNTAKHARAKNVGLRLEQDAEGITVEVSDDGLGFDPEADFSGHLGLRSMGERARRMGGKLEVKSAPGEGTRIRLHLPL